MGSVIQLPLFVSTESLSMALPALKHLWALEFLKLQSDSLIVLLVQMIRNHLVQSNADSASSGCLFYLSSFQHRLFLSVVEEKWLLFRVFIVVFFLSTIKGSKCCLSVHVMSLCARVRPLQVVTWTTHTHKKELDKTAPHPLGHHIVKCELEVWFWWKHYLEFLDCCKTAQLHCG